MYDRVVRAKPLAHALEAEGEPKGLEIRVDRRVGAEPLHHGRQPRLGVFRQARLVGFARSAAARTSVRACWNSWLLKAAPFSMNVYGTRMLRQASWAFAIWSKEPAAEPSACSFSRAFAMSAGSSRASNCLRRTLIEFSIWFR